MERVVRNVRDLDATDRSALERFIGQQLLESQQVIVNVVNVGTASVSIDGHEPQAAADVPDWWRIYEGLSDEAIDELDQLIRQRANLTRDTE